MPDHAAGAIVNEFASLSPIILPQKKLQKLAYIAHGWNLAINDEALICESPQAWDNGPVFRSVWNAFRDRGWNNGFAKNPDGELYKAVLLKEERAIIDHVWRRYGELDADELSDKTHEVGSPWWKAYFGRGRDEPLDDDEIRQHYVDLARAGRVRRRQEQDGIQANA